MPSPCHSVLNRPGVFSSYTRRASQHCSAGCQARRPRRVMMSNNSALCTSQASLGRTVHRRPACIPVGGNHEDCPCLDLCSSCPYPYTRAPSIGGPCTGPAGHTGTVAYAYTKTVIWTGRSILRFSGAIDSLQISTGAVVA